MRIAVIPSALALLLIASSAVAADSPSHTNVHQPPPMHPTTTIMHGPGEWHGSTTPPGMWHGSTTSAHSTSTMPFPPGFSGTVTSIGSNSFTMWSPATNPFFKDQHHATTSITVNVTASTTFDHASSTASLASLSIGQHVVVFGKFSTSTMSMTAAHVIIQAPPEMPKGLQGVLERILKLFGKHEPDAGANSTSAAAVQGGISGLLHALFGWL